MIIYFDNDGTYNQSAINKPVLVNDIPIGFISEINDERVTCYLFDRYVGKVEGLNKNTMGIEFRYIDIDVKGLN